MTLIDGNIKTAQAKLCMMGIKSFPTPDKSANQGEKRYKTKAKTRPKPVIKPRKLRIKAKLCSSSRMVLYLATCLATATGIPAVEISKNQA